MANLNTWLAFLDCMVLEEHSIYVLDAPDCSRSYSYIFEERIGVTCRPIADCVNLVSDLPSTDPAGTS